MLLEVEIKVINGSAIDIYLTGSAGNDDYKDNEDFTFYTDYSEEHTKSIKYTFEAPTDDDYYIIIDNQDNGRKNDTIPTGSVEVEINIEKDDDLKELEEFFEGALLICAITIAVIIIIILMYKFKTMKIIESEMVNHRREIEMNFALTGIPLPSL